MKKLKIFVEYVKDRMNYGESGKNMKLIPAIKYELDMMFHVMGPDLYFKYMTGTAIEVINFE